MKKEKNKEIKDSFLKQKEKKKETQKLEKKRSITDQLKIRDIKTHFQQQEDYYKHKRVSNFWNNIYSEYESNGDKNGNW